jgi:hypothetical protein
MWHQAIGQTGQSHSELQICGWLKNLPDLNLYQKAASTCLRQQLSPRLLFMLGKSKGTMLKLLSVTEQTVVSAVNDSRFNQHATILRQRATMYLPVIETIPCSVRGLPPPGDGQTFSRFSSVHAASRGELSCIP